ncbi:RxLR effector protein [Phytophthora megakarya]|uniref:RxLR effector protein n=1 Tax=Phytophthora megakarya TaxID=4795 RepID=A0A225UPB3_9STRA|nr:RxLR effector protein [Phytophthora megakarya]
MRVIIAFLAAITLSTNWVATNAEQISISTTTSTLAVESIRAVPGVPNEQRLLRSHHVSDDDEEEESDEDEERFKQSKINDLIVGRTSKLFAKWKKAGRDENYIYSKLRDRLPASNFNDVMRWYRAYIN